MAAMPRARIGLSVPTVARNAAFTAMEIAAVAELYPARLTIGLGTEWLGGCARSARTRGRR